jgi:dihydropteroate synthase
MGIVNVTPDSFSDGGRYASRDSAVDHALRLLDEGADWIDIGGESTRPGAEPVPMDIEAARVVPVIEAVRRGRPSARISVDTSKSSVARRAIEAGAAMVNDVSGLEDPEMAALCAALGVELVIMHRRGTPRTMQLQTQYTDLIGEVAEHLSARAAMAETAGVAAEKIVIDPGVGFAKAPADNPRLIASVPRLRALGYRVLIGASRKRFIGDLIGAEGTDDRMFGSIGAAMAAGQHGADIVRVHDVRASREAWTVFAAVSTHRVAMLGGG